MFRSGRRDAITTLLAGTAAVFSRQAPQAEARNKKKKKKTQTPPQTVCPPPVDTCPIRTCCDCSNASPTPGCRLGRDILPGENTADVCDEMCGPNLWTYRLGTTHYQVGEQALGCLAVGTERCTVLECPLV